MRWMQAGVGFFGAVVSCVVLACSGGTADPIESAGDEEALVGSAPVKECGPGACGKNPYGMPVVICSDGSTGGPVCAVRRDNRCGWVIRTCPPPPPPPPAECTATECGKNPFGMPNQICKDGSVGGPVCSRHADGKCGWGIRACPADPGPCTSAECGKNPYGAPNFKCSDGSIGGPVCGRSSDGVCGWHIASCP